MQKRLKLPNGFGSISYYGDKRRRKPYVAKKYIGGRQKPIGYFETYEAALAYLVAYNRDPSLFNASEITFAEVFRLWSAEHYPKPKARALTTLQLIATARLSTRQNLSSYGCRTCRPSSMI